MTVLEHLEVIRDARQKIADIAYANYQRERKLKNVSSTDAADLGIAETVWLLAKIAWAESEITLLEHKACPTPY
jgi:hypothetical protein